MKPKIKIQELTPEYVWREYGVTREEWAAFQSRIAREIAADRKAGKLIEFTGKLPPEPTGQNTVKKPSKLKSKRAAPARQKKAIEFSRAEQQIEFRGKDVLIYEPLASRVGEFCRRHKISPRQFFIEAVGENSERDKAAKVKQPKTRRAKSADKLT